MSVGRTQDILIGPRTTVWALLQAYPFLEPFLLARVRGFEALAEDHARTRWARVMTLDDAPHIRAVAAAGKKDGYKLRTLVEHLVTSDLFRKR